MSQIGLSMPGGGRRGASMNVYTGLLFLAVLALAAGCAFVFVQGGKLSPDGQAFTIQDPTSVKLAN